MRDINPIRSLTREEIDDLLANYDLFKIQPESITPRPERRTKEIVFRHPGTGELVKTEVKE